MKFLTSEDFKEKIGICDTCGRLVEIGFLSTEDDFVWKLDGRSHCVRKDHFSYDMKLIES